MRFGHNKFGNRKTELDGIQFDSRKESERYRELSFMLQAGQISGLETQPKFLIIEGVKWGKKKLSHKHYIADFRYTRSDGVTIIEDVKGVKTPVYRLKKQLFILRYIDGQTGIEFHEVS